MTDSGLIDVDQHVRHLLLLWLPSEHLDLVLACVSRELNCCVICICVHFPPSFFCRLVSGNSIEEKLLKNGTKDLIREVAAQGNDYSMAFLTQVAFIC